MYSAEISRTNPALFLFLLDQSGSMADAWQPGEQKAKGLADIINRQLYELTIRCAKSEGVRNYFEIAVLGYGGRVQPALVGSLSNREVVPIAEIADNPARLEERSKKEADGAGGVMVSTVRFPVWVDPVASGGTPMCEALNRGATIVESWVASHPESFPPVVINMTDGEPTDGDPTAAADRLRSIVTTDGQALLFNIHLSSVGSKPIVFPSDESLLPDDHAKLLFRMSSFLPRQMVSLGAVDAAADTPTEGSRGFVFNGDMVAVITALDIGTRPSNLR
jgi:hypothetical protein